ncbi:hypothetical protein ABHF33_08335 [Chitinibacter sp. FCG-7]|uniref:Lipocalin-like domain-containing protein n=1 Tax=Chitinibacter mangrovi TaxID=3153927 RepID=A0AAU7FEE8_9NEIS
MSNPFIGVWQLVSGECGEPGQAVEAYDMSLLSSRKVIGGRHFMFLTLKDGAFYSSASGAYTFDGLCYTEQPDMASYAPMVGQAYVFEYQIDGDLWHNRRFEDGRQVEYEIWRKIGA